MTTTRTDAIYARYSSHSQDDSTSIVVQIEACERAAGGPTKHYIDQARSGRSVGGREALHRLLADARAGKIGRLFLYKFDRLGRAAETHVIVAELEDECGVQVISATEGKEALARGIQLVVAENYSKVLAERTRDGLKRRFREGTWTGGKPPYGFRIVDGPDGRRRLAIDPNEADVVRFVFRTYLAEAVGFKELARRLKGRGAATREGAPWSFTTVRSILTNPTMTGEVWYNRRSMKLDKRTGRRVPRPKDEADHLSYTDEALAIVEKVEFDRVQQMLDARSGARGPRAAKEVRPFTGFLFCGECGSVFYSRKSKNAKGEYRYYNCGCRQKGGPGACPNSATVREDKLMDKVLEVCTDLFEDTDAIVEAVIREAEKRIASNRDEALKLRREIAELEKKNTAFLGLMIDPEVPAEAKRAISRQLGENESRREQVQEMLARLGEQANEGTQKLARAVRQAMAEAKANFAGLATPAQLNRLIGELVGPMVVRGDGTIQQKTPEMAQAPAGAEACVTSTVAGGGFEPPTSRL